jgi:hypothetical protein
MEKFIDCADKGLIEASYAKSSWSKHCSAFKCVEKFKIDRNWKCNWPMTLEDTCKFTSWALQTKKLQITTVKSYLSSIKIVHELANVKYNGDCQVVKSLLRGRENLDRYESKSKNSRKVMTLSLLRVIGNQIAKTEWSNDSKLTVWGACTTAFLGALRFGEILPQKSNDYCEMETLLWNDLKFRSDGSVLMHIKLDKVRNMKGSFIDIFEFPLAGCCPVKTLNQMRETKFNSNSPVFQFKSGKNLCSAQLNTILQKLLCPIIGPAAYQISGHSFRAGLPSAMASKPDLANDKDIKAWGRWSSDSYLLYTRLKHKQKKALFEKIVSVLETKN